MTRCYRARSVGLATKATTIALTGGVLTADNLLRRGGVADATDRSSSTRAARRITCMSAYDPGRVSSIVPIRVAAG